MILGTKGNGSHLDHDELQRLIQTKKYGMSRDEISIHEPSTLLATINRKSKQLQESQARRVMNNWEYVVLKFREELVKKMFLS